ncbi:NAD(P)-binding protein [Aureobasidium pullulans EXF-150]|uniref:NAD(P)-binding protein n=1 Tax=Aureobasidium pullulans EXF-150 TaxID=1043002 RepID=A0A074WZ59_AURPU|nr:NAD(P)-binding protein [Aureobasidium pullulans EXF-150]KEQ78488.1 NAD(P)-binding protein [Aureobasidium pullulans EXF-150]
MTRSLFKLPREGFYIDFLVLWSRATVLNPYLAALIWASVGFWRFDNREAFSTTVYAWPFDTWYASLISTFTLLGILLKLHDFLNDQILNNWNNADSWDWNQEIVVVTGGCSGIGLSIVEQLLLRNAQTTIVIVDYVKPLFEIAADGPLRFYQCDLSDSTAIQQICKAIKADVGDPTVLVNNAGLTRGQTVMEGEYGDVEMTFRTNIIAPFLLTKEFLPAMVARNHGHIVGISSMSAMITPAGLADYGATKAGMIILQETLRAELKFRHNAPKVRVSTAVLGFIKTPMFKGKTNQSNFLSPLIHVDTVGEDVVDVLYSRRSRTTFWPGISRYLASLRGGPEWLLALATRSTENLRVDYKGRQKLDRATGRLID